jgi:hypothetical protein
MPTTDLIRADWYARTADIMSEQTIAANGATLQAQLVPGFVWDSGRPLTDAERADIRRCLEILHDETARRAA